MSGHKLTSYKRGNRWFVCDVCGFDYRFLDMRKGISEQQKERPHAKTQRAKSLRGLLID